MIIKNIKITNEDESVTLSAECKIRKLGWDRLYFSVDKKYKDFIYNDASPFGAALLLPCMRAGEELIIQGTISQKLYEGMLKTMSTVSTWGLGLKTITIKVDTLTKDTQEAKNIGAFFSGGVDSFYTYLKNKNNKNGGITHFILVNGYDIDLRNKDLWQKTLTNVQKIADKENIKLIVVESNLHRPIEPILNWGSSFVGGLAAVGLFLRKKLKVVYRSSAYKEDPVSDMGFDENYSTEKLRIIYEGADVTRLEKVEKIAAYKVVLDNLRVCYLNKKGLYNCGTCDKCLRTMVELTIAGKLKQAKTFPETVDIELIKNLQIGSKFSAIFQKENLAGLKKLNIEPELQNAIEISLKTFSLQQNKQFSNKKVIDTIIYLDHVYNKGLVFNTISAMKRKF